MNLLRNCCISQLCSLSSSARLLVRKGKSNRKRKKKRACEAVKVGSHQCWSVLKYHLLRAQKLAIPSRETSHRPTFLSRDPLEIKWKVYGHWK